MNLSGESVKGLVLKHDVPLSRLLVVVDDLSLAVGRLRVRPSGSSGGQKGLQNVIDCLGTPEFPRLRIGVGGEWYQPGDEKADYILSRFSRAERTLVDAAVETACDAVEAVLTDGLEAAMNRFNGPPEIVPAG
jgi:PTH1 family peptidyl-tRNA hydrolase